MYVDLDLADICRGWIGIYHSTHDRDLPGLMFTPHRAVSPQHDPHRRDWTIFQVIIYSAIQAYAVDLVMFARFQFPRISRGGLILEFKNFAKIIIIIALLKKNENLRSPRILTRENYQIYSSIIFII